jgi:magnesium transporter
MLTSTVGRLLRRGATPSLKKVLAKYRPEEVAVSLVHITSTERLQVFELCPDDEYRVSVLSELDLDIAADMVEELEACRAAALLQQMNPDDAADILGELPDDRQAELLKLLRSGKGDEDSVEDLLRYDESTAGGIMNPHAFSLGRTVTVSEAIAALQKAERVEMAFYVYVVNDEDKLAGVVSLRQLVISKPEKPLEDIMTTDVISVQPEEDQEEVARLASRYGFLAIPVVDDTRQLLGIVTIDDVIDVIREEATEDILKMAGAGHALIESHSFWTSFRVRLPWLLATAIGGALAAAIMGEYEDALSEVIALAFFIPVVLGMGGNVGTQTASIVVRGLAMGRISPRHFWRVMGRELGIGLALGVIYGSALGAFGFVRFANSLGGWENAMIIGAVVGVSTICTMTLGAIVAAVFPLVFERLHIDPAAASGPFVTTAVDIMGTLAYFFVAKSMLGL